MLGLFRKNLFINIAMLFLFTVVLRGVLFVQGSATDMPWQQESFFDFYQVFPNKAFQIGLSIVLIFIQALLISRYVIEHRLSRALSLVPGAVFVLYVALVLEPESMSMVLFANLFFILGIGNLYRIYKKHKPIGTIFNAGFFLGVATLIYFPYIVFFVTSILGLFSLRAVNLKELIQLTTGFLAAFLLVGIYFFYQNNLNALSDIVSYNFYLPSFDFSKPLVYLKLGVLIFCVLSILLYQNSLRKKKKFDAIKKIELTFWQLIMGFILLFFLDNGHDEYLLIMSTPIAILAGLILESKDGYIVKEFLFILFIGFFGFLSLNII